MTEKKITTDVYEYSYCSIPLKHGIFDFRVFRNRKDSTETVVISMGDLSKDRPVFVRLHSECLTGEVFGSKKCDCAEQLDSALKTVAQRNLGAVVYLRQEGRGIGLGNKIKAYHLQNFGLDTIEANNALGFPVDLRDYKYGLQILKKLGVKEIILNTNNPQKIKAVRDSALELFDVVPSHTLKNSDNSSYLKTKWEKLEHNLGPLFL